MTAPGDPIEARKRSVAERRTDTARWTSRDSFPDHWDSRAAAAGPLLAGFGWVCDIGCGAQAVKRHLAPGTRYRPADIKAWTPETETCELNAGRRPLRALRQCDVVVMLGVLEYIVEPAALLARLYEFAEFLVVSYSAPELWAVDREAFGWVNAIPAAEFRTMLGAAGYVIDHEQIFEGRQLLLRARNPRFGAAARARRWVARRLLLPA